MRFSRLTLAGAVAATVTIFAGCRCGDVRTPGGSAELNVIFDREDGSTFAAREGEIVFGSIFSGQTTGRKLVINNAGRVPMTLLKVEQVSGAEIDFTGEAMGSSVFQVKFQANQEVEGTTSVELDVAFSPPAQDEATAVVTPYEAVFRLVTVGPVEGQEIANITFKGTGIPGACEFPKELDFGTVAVNDSYTLTQPIVNNKSIAATATVGELRGNDAASFKFNVDSIKGAQTLPPQTTDKKVSMRFEPTEARSYLAFVNVQPAEGCPVVAVTLKGKGASSVLVWNPTTVDFGFLTPGLERTQAVEFENLGNTDVKLAGFDIAALPAEFKVAEEAGQTPTTLDVPARGGKATLLLAFSPKSLGKKDSQFRFTTNLAKQQNGSIALKGAGGGPEITVNPSPTLNYGRVAYFPDAATFQSRKLTIMNTGNKPAGVLDNSANLRLTQAPTIRVLNAATAAGEFEILGPTPCATPGTPPNCYDSTNGLEASIGKNITELVLKLTPASLGNKEAEVTIYSNDPARPEVKILVTADVQALPPCEYSLTPSTLNFGVVGAGDYKDLSFTVRNLSSDPANFCVLSNLDIGPSSHTAFSLPAGKVAEKDLAAGESYVVTTRVWPKSATTGSTLISGSAEFFISSKTKPHAVVSLQANLADACLSVAPDVLNFGTVERGCNSSTRSLTLYNTCPLSVKVTKIEIGNAAGQPAGGPDCSGAAACPEFHLVSVPTIPGGGLDIVQGAASPPTFTARYKPIDFGADHGNVVVSAVQNGNAVTYVIPLEGTGDTVGKNTDIFRQEARPKADILLVIDNSCSMIQEQTSLANNFAAFISYAKTANVDYQIGVTSTDMSASGEKGRLIGDASNPKILTPNTPDVDLKFKSKVVLGTSGGATEQEFAPALSALTAPLITSDNVGFIRDDAKLAVVAVTDEPEQSPLSVSYYYNQFLSVKGFKRANDFTFNAIFGLTSPAPSGCSYTADTGRMQQMVTLTNGVMDNICTSDWAKTLEELGKRALGYQATFFLNAVPDESGGKQIKVYVDDIERAKVDDRGATAWSYDPVANAVTFEPMYVPEPGQTLKIEYFVACIP